VPYGLRLPRLRAAGPFGAASDAGVDIRAIQSGTRAHGEDKLVTGKGQVRSIYVTDV
jgi:hypothetical protein